MSDFSKNSVIVKAVSAGVFAGVMDRVIKQSTDSTPSAIFGASVGAGILATSLVTSYIPIMDSSGVSTGLVSRGIEIGVTSAGSWVAYNKVAPMIMGNIRKPDFDMKSVGIIIAADFFGEFTKQWVQGNTSLFA